METINEHSQRIISSIEKVVSDSTIPQNVKGQVLENIVHTATEKLYQLKAEINGWNAAGKNEPPAETLRENL